MVDSFRFQTALVDDQWQNNVVISVGEEGVIESIDCDVEGIGFEQLVALPGMVNVHSHAFQRAFAGLSEYRTASQDSFWTWRKRMYEFVGRLSPDEVYEIAKQLYLEMLAAGYTWVGEFHYLHNEIGGDTYSKIGEMSDAIFRAAGETGIGLCHLPVLYQRGGFDDEPVSNGQNRFVLNDDSFCELVEYCQSTYGDTRNTEHGLAIHSLRAVGSKSALSTIEFVRRLCPKAPIHIHVAEQTAEIDACLKTHGKRSVEFLFEQLPVDERWCLIHATHLNDHELNQIAASKAVVGLCPTTEANLGDGIFRAEEFLSANGRISIGSDSHCSVDLREELRMLEYGQRLATRRRAILGTEDMSVGRNLYCRAALGGAQAIGINAGRIAIGKRADFTLVDPSHPSIGHAEGDRILDRFVFVNIGNPIAGVVVGGRRIETHSG
jgi:formimidoylglutamate deiminase